MRPLFLFRVFPNTDDSLTKWPSSAISFSISMVCIQWALCVSFINLLWCTRSPWHFGHGPLSSDDTSWEFGKQRKSDEHNKSKRGNENRIIKDKRKHGSIWFVFFWYLDKWKWQCWFDCFEFDLKDYNFRDQYNLVNICIFTWPTKVSDV